MRKFFHTTFIAFLSIGVVIQPANAKISSHPKCTKISQLGVQDGQSNGCETDDSVFIQKATRTSSATFQKKCAPDPLVPKSLVKTQTESLARGTCVSPSRYVVTKLTSTQPKTIQTPADQLLSIGSCKLKMWDQWNHDEDFGYHMKPTLKIQIVPFQTQDYAASTNPQKDYKDWFDFVLTGLNGMTDVDSDYQIIIPNKYYKLEKSLISYNVGTKYAESVNNSDNLVGSKFMKLADDVIAIADIDIDFSNIDKVFVVGPPNTTRDVLAGWGGPNFQHTDEKSLQGYFVTDHPYDYKSKDWISRGPFGLLHELMHLTNTLRDHMGVNQKDGMYLWGNMSGVQMDFIAWDKWIAKYIDDTQVRCAPTNKTSLHWIKPSTVDGKYEKLLMIPLSDTKAIAVESIRASGFNYKIPVCQQGALVYTIDTVEMEKTYDGGMRVIFDKSKSRPGCAKATPADHAALKLNESLKISGYKVTVIEAGSFGDVVKVEKAS